ncbi:hypothetical protein C2L64_45420 [Paraburkholderia hospita]|uniref:Uncharacterized protein n=1 Tax=Paraburkholderia hospita TaxID=169430 RepID=A0AAN1JKC1_9BURK|nr:hypothetical protein C2L64_45420 [Paraburkholderia hospita]
MLRAVLEPYAGKLARTVPRGPSFREGTRLPSNEFLSFRQQMMQQAIFMKASWRLAFILLSAPFHGSITFDDCASASNGTAEALESLPENM